MNSAQVLTNWSLSREPQLALDYTLTECSDVTGQLSVNLQPDPNMYIVEITCDDATLAAIQADSNYSVLWSEPIVEDAP